MFVGKMVAASAAILLSTVAAPAAIAAPVVVVNASFESPVQASGTYEDGNGVITGWDKFPTAQGNLYAGVQNFGDNTYFKPSDGTQVVYINNGTIGQNLGLLAANTTYTLTVAAGTQPNYGRGSTGSLGFYGSANQEYSSTVAVPLNVGSMTDFSTSFTTGSSVTGNLLIRLSNRSGDQVLFDNVRVSAVSTLAAAVPEPTVWSTMIVGAGMVGGTLRRRRKIASRISHAA